jgi:L-lysine 6-transaminase
MCAITLPSGAVRDTVIRRCREEQSLMLLGCGPDAIRWRPSLAVTEADLDLALGKLRSVLTSL